MVDAKFGEAGASVVIEEFLTGERSRSWCSRRRARRAAGLGPGPQARRRRRQGPNTGGMGTVSPRRRIAARSHKRIMQEIVAARRSPACRGGPPLPGRALRGADDHPARAEGARVQRRFGDPETQVIMARMRSDIVPILRACASGAARRRPASSGPRRRGVRGAGEPGLPRHARDRQGDQRARRAQGLERRGRLPRRDQARGRRSQDRRRARARRDRARRQPRVGGSRAPTRRSTASSSTACSTAATSARGRSPTCTAPSRPEAAPASGRRRPSAPAPAPGSAARRPLRRA